MRAKYINRSGRSVRFLLVAAVFTAMSATALAQKVVDRTVATVSDGVHTELITYSDLIWRLALESRSPVTAPTSQELNAALQKVIEERVFVLEAGRLPRAAPTEKEIADEISRLLTLLPAGELERRLNQMGFKSVQDPTFQEIIGRKITAEKYIDFRFRSFIVITADDEAKYFRDVFVPEFRRLNPEAFGLPTLDSQRPIIRERISESRVAANIETFLDEAKRRSTLR